jgi:phosphopantothenoylcysteine decarboxylase/phosphopantothenate--cysteine ligase
MSKILITSGPTRQHLDPIRYLTNASSGRMGAALAAAAIEDGHEVVVVSGPVQVEYPDEAEVIPVVSTEEMLEACLAAFPRCDGLIGVAAPCDYRPVTVAASKIRKTGGPLQVHLVETPDVVATLGSVKQAQWMVAFTLETEDHRIRAMHKLERKSCDLVVVNGPGVLNSPETSVEVIDRQGAILGAFAGSKRQVAREILRVIRERLMR